MRIINLTGNPATPAQRAAGVVDLPSHVREDAAEALTFNELPTPQDILDRADILARLVIANRLGDGLENQMPSAAMIDGPPFLMRALEDALTGLGIKPLYAFSVRGITEAHQADGVIVSLAAHRRAIGDWVAPERHLGFVEGAGRSSARQ